MSRRSCRGPIGAFRAEGGRREASTLALQLGSRSLPPQTLQPSQLIQLHLVTHGLGWSAHHHSHVVGDVDGSGEAGGGEMLGESAGGVLGVGSESGAGELAGGGRESAK